MTAVVAANAAPAMEYKLFQPRKCVDDADWKSELQAKVAAFAELEKAGSEKADDVQLFLSEVVWAVIRGELSAERATEVMAKTPVATKEPLQQVFADVLWVVGFSVSETGADSKDREKNFRLFCELLERQAVIPLRALARSLEVDTVPADKPVTDSLKKKTNQARTKARYTITRFNLLREHTEGYAKLVYLLDRLGRLDFYPEATEEQISGNQAVLIEDVIRSAGFGHLCPNRILSMALDIYELRLSEAEDKSPQAMRLLGLMSRFPRRRLTEVIVFQLQAIAAPSGARDPKAAPLPAPSRPSQFLAIATLVQRGLLDVDTLWGYLDPADATLRQLHKDLMAKYDREVSQVHVKDLSSGPAQKEKHTFNELLQEFNQLGNQKLRLAAGLVSANCWRSAHRVLCHLREMLKPCLNHHVRSALCDLLKWLIDPVLAAHSGDDSTGRFATKYGIETTYRCVRRFELGLEAMESAEEAEPTNGHKEPSEVKGASGVPVALRPTADLTKLLPQIRMVLEHLEYFMHQDVHLLTSLWKVVLISLRSSKKSEDGKFVLDDHLVSMVYKHLLPAVSMVPSNPFLGNMVWSVMQHLSVFQRFLLYSCWETMYDNFLLKLAYERTKSATKQILKRVVANPDKKDLVASQSNFHISELCHSNPLPCIETMLKDLEIGFNVNMIQPYVECTHRCPEMTADVMGYVLSRTCAKPSSGTRVFLNQADATLSPWLVNLGEFVGRFYKMHPHTNLVGLLTIITKRINGELVSTNGTAQAETFKKESLIRVVLENLIEFMGGVLTVTDLNSEQLLCLAGGPRLKSESIAIAGKMEEGGRKERARQALLKAFVDQDLIPVILHSLSLQRHHFLSEEFSEEHGGGGGLKLLGLLFDGNHECFLKMIDFLAQACPREKYASLLPPMQQIFSMYDPALAFLAIRHGLPSYGKGAAAAAAAAEAAKEAKDGVELVVVPESEALTELDRVCRVFLPATFEDDGLSRQFYVTFWRLSLQDVFTPRESYERAQTQNQLNIKQIEQKKRDMERQLRGEHSHNRDYKTLKKEASRLQELSGKLREELLVNTQDHKKVCARLEQEKTKWFIKPSPASTASFVSEMITQRVFASHSDALFCCHFTRMLVKLKTPGFQLLDFYNCWTIMLTQSLRCCSEREAQIFGVFLREMMSYIITLRKDEAVFASEKKDNPTFNCHYYPRDHKGAIEVFDQSDLKRGHAKWEGRIYKAIKAGLESKEWMERRNALLMLSQSCEMFPMVEKYAKTILAHVERLRDEEEKPDLKTLAGSMAVKLRTLKGRWMDKAPPQERKKDAGAEDAKRSSKKDAEEVKSGSGPKSGLDATASTKEKDSKTTSATEARKASEKRDGAEKRTNGDRAGHGDKAGGEEKRPRREEDRELPAATKDTRETKEREHRSSAAATKEPKESSGRDNRSSVASKDTKEAKEAKESREHKDAADRKRGERPVAHEDRSSDKRPRKSERSEVHASMPPPRTSERRHGEERSSHAEHRSSRGTASGGGSHASRSRR